MFLSWWVSFVTLGDVRLAGIIRFHALSLRVAAWPHHWSGRSASPDRPPMSRQKSFTNECTFTCYYCEVFVVIFYFFIVISVNLIKVGLMWLSSFRLKVSTPFRTPCFKALVPPFIKLQCKRVPGKRTQVGWPDNSTQVASRVEPGSLPCWKGVIHMPGCCRVNAATTRDISAMGKGCDPGTDLGLFSVKSRVRPWIAM